MQNKDQLTSKQAMISFLIPPVGIINYFRKKDSSPGVASASGKIALFSLALTSVGALSKFVFNKKQNLSGTGNTYRGNWTSTFITVPDLKIKIRVPSGPRCLQKVFVEFQNNQIIIADVNGMIIKF